MAADVLSMITQVFAQLVAWFELILTESGFKGLYIGAVFLALCGRYLLQPILGSSGSDKVSKKRDDE